MIKWYYLTLFVLFNQPAMAQVPDTLIHINDAITLAEKGYHLLQAKKYEAAAATSNVAIARYQKMPVVDATYQAGIATANNLIGAFYPNGILPITGPPSTSNRYDPATTSAAGLLLNWQAFSFGEKNAQINLATADAKLKNADYQKELFNHTVNVISAYLDVLLASDDVTIHQDNISRVTTNLKQSKILSGTGIKAGVDSVLFLSELSRARVGLLNAQKQLEVKQWLLARLIAVNKLPIPIDSSFLQRIPHILNNPDTTFSAHPLMLYAQSQYLLSQSKEKQLKKAYLPKVTVWGTGFSRGSGFQPDGSIKTWDGLGLSRYNYGAGLQVAFPIMKLGEVKRQLKQQDLLTKAAEENIADNQSFLITQQQIATTTYKHSIDIATETQAQLKAGQKAFSAMQIRYNTGLVNFADLIQTQYNLLQAELEVRQTNWDVWKALLLTAAVKGDINIFLNEIK
jgi:outer membrane protein TolC